MSLSPQDRVNQACYADPWAVQGLAELQGFTDEGERAAFWHLADTVRGQPILDLGVGPGRTVPLLRALSADYVGLDYLPTMVDAAQRRYAAVADIRLGDARDLGAFADGRFALVVFSYNGIDSVSRADRQRVLAEAFRVLRPGGVFWFSTLNLAGPAYRHRPWRPLPPRRPRRALGWLRYGVQWLQAWSHVPAHTRAYQRGLRLGQQGEGWAVAPFFPGGWRLLVHYTSLARQLADLAEAGFAPAPRVFESEQGRAVGPGDALDAVFSFHLLATRPSPR